MLVCGTILLAACSGNNRYRYETTPGDPMNVQTYKLKNGLTVSMTVNKEQPRIQTYIAVRTGSKNDPAETTGLAHYLEHLMFKGTTQFGTQNYEAEKPLLDTITTLFENYRTLTDPALPYTHRPCRPQSSLSHHRLHFGRSFAVCHPTRI